MKLDAAMRILAAAGMLAVVLLLAACGSDDSGSATIAPAETTTTDGVDTDAGPPEGDTGGEPESGPGPGDLEVAIEALLVDDDNQFVCGEIYAKKLLRSAYGDLQGCLNGRAPETLANSVKVRKLKISGETATAVAVTSGGIYDGEPLDVEAVIDGDAWRIDGLVADIPAGP